MLWLYDDLDFVEIHGWVKRVKLVLDGMSESKIPSKRVLKKVHISFTEEKVEP